MLLNCIKNLLLQVAVIYTLARFCLWASPPIHQAVGSTLKVCGFIRRGNKFLFN